MSDGQRSDTVWDIKGSLPARGDTWVLEASAGTGKTYQIASLILRLVAEADVKIERVLAITFTTAATGELRERIRARLVQARALLDSPPEKHKDVVLQHLIEFDAEERVRCRARLDDAVRDFDLASISTIHSFSQSILRGYALEAGHSSQLEVVSDLTVIHDRVVEDALVRLWDKVSPQAATLYKAVKFNRDSLKQVVEAVTKSNAPEWVPPLAEGGAEAQRRLDEAAIEAWLKVEGNFLRDLDTKWREAARALVADREAERGTKSKKDVVPKLFDGLSPNAHSERLALLETPGQRLNPFKLNAIPKDDDKNWPPYEKALNHIVTKVPPAIKDNEVAKNRVWWPFIEACEAVVKAAREFVKDFNPFVAFAAGVVPQVEAELERARAMTFDQMVSLVARRITESGGADSPLAPRVRERYDVVLVDEFQDTDESQWTTLRAAFHGHARLLLIGDPKQAIYSFRGADLSVYLSARQAASRRFTMTTNYRSDPPTVEAQNHLWLKGSPEAPRAAAFDVDGIDYIRVDGNEAVPRLSPGAPGLDIRWVDARAASARGARGERITNKDIGSQLVADLAAAEIKALLENGTTRRSKDKDGTEVNLRLRPRDFGVLVADRYEAAHVRKALAALGIPAVSAAQGTVFKSPAAEWLCRWLDALVEPSSRDVAARIVATTPLFGMSHDALARALEAEAQGLTGADSPAPAPADAELNARAVARWAEVRAQLSQARSQWRRERFVGCFERTLTAPLGGLANVLAQPMGERLATDLRHLVELLNARDRTRRSGPADLALWLRLQRDESGKEFEQRLETDDNAVRIETVFVSKGLQYPVVLLPFAWTQKTKPKPKPEDCVALVAGRPANADLDVRPRLGLGTQGYSALLDDVCSQMRVESLRKDYVALTRAEHRTIMWVGPIGADNATGKDDPTKFLGGSTYHTLLRRLVDQQETQTLLAFLESLNTHFGGDPKVHTRFSEVTHDEAQAARRARPWTPTPESDKPAVLQAHIWQRSTSLGAGFGVTSFSELKGQGAIHDADEKSRGNAPEEVVEGEASPSEEAVFTSQLTEPAEPAPGEALAALEGRGTEYGSFVHALYEHLDFAAVRAKTGEDLTTLVQTQGRTFGFDPQGPGGPRAAEYAQRVLTDIQAHLPKTLTTPLDAVGAQGAAGDGAGAPGLTLAQLTVADRLDELVFDLRLGAGLRERRASASLPSVDTRRALEALLAHPRRNDPAWHGRPWLSSLAARDAETGGARGLFKEIDGFLTGSIDLVFEHAGRFWVADYKTNRIKGPASQPGHYSAEWMAWEMARMGYPLQSLIYTLALHRHLKQRLRHYDYDTHVGGALYLFVRGMSGPDTPRDPVTGTARGVLADRWPKAVVEGVEAALGLDTQEGAR